MKRAALCTVVLLALSACNDSTAPWVGPHQIESLRFTASIRDSTLARGDTATVVFAIHNDGIDTVTLQFDYPNCQALSLYIATPNGELPYSSVGGGCRISPVTMIIAPGAAYVYAMTLRGGSLYAVDGPEQGIPLSPGDYRAFARLTHPNFPIVSPVVRFRALSN
ncbi:MAG TPA: hypothetical protein VJR92_13050 [Gemmatimonadaceae bacterium]|nr:hypothetical protein [Gemmatimonadaceae bacterium]